MCQFRIWSRQRLRVPPHRTELRRFRVGAVLEDPFQPGGGDVGISGEGVEVPSGTCLRSARRNGSWRSRTMTSIAAFRSADWSVGHWSSCGAWRPSNRSSTRGRAMSTTADTNRVDACGLAYKNPVSSTPIVDTPAVRGHRPTACHTPRARTARHASQRRSPRRPRRSLDPAPSSCRSDTTRPAGPAALDPHQRHRLPERRKITELTAITVLHRRHRPTRPDPYTRASGPERRR